MATAELALVIPTLVLVLAMCLSGLGLAIDQIRCVDAARAAARAASRGDALEEVARRARSEAPEGAQVTIRRGDDEVVVTVTAPGGRLSLPGLPRARATTTAPTEPRVRG